MSPTDTAFYTADMVLQDAVVGSNLTLEPLIFSNSRDLLSRKFGTATTLTSVCGAMAHFVCMIIFGCIPSQVSEAVILWVSIIVAAFHSFWSLAYKCLKHQAVRPRDFLTIIFPQAKVGPWVGAGNGQFLQFLTLGRTDAAKIGDFISVFIPYNRAPYFHKYTSVYSMEKYRGT